MWTGTSPWPQMVGLATPSHPLISSSTSLHKRSNCCSSLSLLSIHHILAHCSGFHSRLASCLASLWVTSASTAWHSSKPDSRCLSLPMWHGSGWVSGCLPPPGLHFAALQWWRTGLCVSTAYPCHTVEGIISPQALHGMAGNYLLSHSLMSIM